MVNKSKGNNTRLFIVLGIVVFAIIIGLFIGNSFNEKFTNNNPNNKIIYFFSMNGCHYCEKFQSTWDDLVNYYKGNNSVTLIKKDINDKDNDGVKFGDKFDIKGAPTIMKVVNNNPTVYDDERDFNKLKSWINL